MKRNAIIFMGILLMLLAAVTAWRMRPEPVEGSELYQRCKDVPGVRVGFIKDFPINDTITCDVTTFEALTDEGWEWMSEEAYCFLKQTTETTGRFHGYLLSCG